MKKIGILILSGFMAFALMSCGGETAGVDTYDYANLSFPNFSTINPVRYAGLDSMNQEYLGWQDFGTGGEIMTNPWPRSTYAYQMYSYFIRNDLQQIYQDVPLPESIEDLPAWIADTTKNGHRVLWFSMIAGTLPDSITLLDSETLVSENGIQPFLRAEYRVSVDDAQTDWIIYFMNVEGVYSTYSIRVNEMIDNVRSTTDFMVKTYRLKSPEA